MMGMRRPGEAMHVEFLFQQAVDQHVDGERDGHARTVVGIERQDIPGNGAAYLNRPSGSAYSVHGLLFLLF